MTGSWKSGPIRYFHSVFTRESPLKTQWGFPCKHAVKISNGPRFSWSGHQKNIFYFLYSRISIYFQGKITVCAQRISCGHPPKKPSKCRVANVYWQGSSYGHLIRSEIIYFSTFLLSKGQVLLKSKKNSVDAPQNLTNFSGHLTAPKKI